MEPAFGPHGGGCRAAPCPLQCVSQFLYQYANPPLSGSPKDTIARFGLGDEGLIAWRDAQLPEDRFPDWLTDRLARRPTGARARVVYGADDVHDFARRAILDALDLQSGDRLLDVGCGGGQLLRDAANAGAVVTGLDHSEEMVKLARERAPGAEVTLGEAERLPFKDATFTAVSMSVVFFFFADPAAVLHECVRALAPAGRLAIFTTSAALRGTPAAPEPIASLGHFHTDAELVAFAAAAGLVDPTVWGDDGGQLLTAKR
jgi:SAM-dependent methyltransferase